MESIDLPDSYEQTCLFLMAVEPHLVHAMWDLGPEARKELTDPGRDNLHPVSFILRFHDVTGISFDGVNSRASFDVEIDVNEKKRYVPLRKAGRAYMAELGTVNGTGVFSPLARSNVTEMPRNGITPRSGPQFTMVREVAVQEERTAEVPPDALSHDRLSVEQENSPKSGPTMADDVVPPVVQDRASATDVAAKEARENIRPEERDKTFSILATDVLARLNLFHRPSPDAKRKMQRPEIHATRVIEEQGQQRQRVVDLTERSERTFVAGISSK